MRIRSLEDLGVIDVTQFKQTIMQNQFVKKKKSYKIKYIVYA